MSRIALAFSSDLLISSELESRINPDKIFIAPYGVKLLKKGTEVAPSDFLDYDPKLGEPRCFPKKGSDLFKYFKEQTSLLSEVEFQNVEVPVLKGDPKVDEDTGNPVFLGRSKKQRGLGDLGKTTEGETR